MNARAAPALVKSPGQALAGTVKLVDSVDYRPTIKRPRSDVPAVPSGFVCLRNDEIAGPLPVFVIFVLKVTRSPGLAVVGPLCCRVI